MYVRCVFIRTKCTFVLHDEASRIFDLRKISKHTRGLQNAFHTGA